MKLLLATTALAAGLLLAAAPAARAQDDPGMSMFNSYNQMAVNMSLVDVNNAAVMAAARNAGATKGRTATTRPASRSLSLAYTPTAALRQQTVQKMSGQLQASNPAAAQAFTKALGPGKADYGQLFGELVKSSGLPANNAATALAAYLELGYAIVNNVQDDKSLTPAMDQGLQRQAAGLLSQHKNLTSAATVAQFGEETKLQTVLLYLGWQSVRKSGTTEQFRRNIAQQFKQKGLDMSAVRLTEQGLVKN